VDVEIEIKGESCHSSTPSNVLSLYFPFDSSFHLIGHLCNSMCLQDHPSPQLPLLIIFSPPSTWFDGWWLMVAHLSIIGSDSFAITSFSSSPFSSHTIQSKGPQLDHHIFILTAFSNHGVWCSTVTRSQERRWGGGGDWGSKKNTKSIHLNIFRMWFSIRVSFAKMWIIEI